MNFLAFSANCTKPSSGNRAICRIFGFSEVFLSLPNFTVIVHKITPMFLCSLTDFLCFI